MLKEAAYLPAQVWPAWLPGAVAKAEQHVFAIPRARAQLPTVKQQLLPPMLFSASFQSSISKPTNSTPARPDSTPSRRSPLLPQQQIRTSSRIPPLIRQTPPSSQLRAFTTSPTSPPPAQTEPSSSISKQVESPQKAKWIPPSQISIHTRPVVIVGAGTLGRRLAVIWASHGSPVTIYDTSPAALTSATTYIADTLSAYCSEQGTHPGKIHFTSSLTDACTNPWLAIEAVPEEIELKISILGRLDRTVPTDCIIATNSSSFKSSELISEVQHRERVLNTLYYVPPENKCVELLPNNYTSPLVPRFLTQQLEVIGLNPISIPASSPTLLFPRLWGSIKRETLRMLSEGVAKPEEIDELFRDFFGAKKGVCEKMDEVGLDVVAAVERHFLEMKRGREEEGLGWKNKDAHVQWLEKEFIKQGKLGDKKGGGLMEKGWVVGKEKIKHKAAEEVWKEHAVDLSGL